MFCHMCSSAYVLCVCMCVYVCVFMCVYVCVYVQVHVSNNASVCTSVSLWERMHVHALCVSCKEITTRNHCNHSRVSEAGIRREF